MTNLRKQINKQALKKMKTYLATTSLRNYPTVINATEDTVEICDGFYWARVPNTNKLLGQYTKDALNKYLLADVDAPKSKEDACNYPDTTKLLKGGGDKLFRLNSETLIKALSILTADSVDKGICFTLDPGGSLHLTHQDGAEAMICPMSDLK